MSVPNQKANPTQSQSHVHPLSLLTLALVASPLIRMTHRLANMVHSASYAGFSIDGTSQNRMEIIYPSFLVFSKYHRLFHTSWSAPPKLAFITIQQPHIETNLPDFKSLVAQVNFNYQGLFPRWRIVSILASISRCNASPWLGGGGGRSDRCAGGTQGSRMGVCSASDEGMMSMLVAANLGGAASTLIVGVVSCAPIRVPR